MKQRENVTAYRGYVLGKYIFKKMCYVKPKVNQHQKTNS